MMGSGRNVGVMRSVTPPEDQLVGWGKLVVGVLAESAAEPDFVEVKA